MYDMTNIKRSFTIYNKKVNYKFENIILIYWTLTNYNLIYFTEESKKNQFDYTEIPKNLYKKAEILYCTLSEVIGNRKKIQINMRSNFYEIGGNSLNSVTAVVKLSNKGYWIKLNDFVHAKNLKEILLKMKDNYDISYANYNFTEDNMQYYSEFLKDEHKLEVIK